MGYDTNMVVLQGRLTRDPDTQMTQGGKCISNFCIAVGEGKDKVSFFDVTAWEQKAEFSRDYLKKGSAVIVSGRLTQQTWEDKKGGGPRRKVVINAMGITFQAGGKKEEGYTSSESKSESERRLESAGLTGSASSDSHFSDEDIPF